MEESINCNDPQYDPCISGKVPTKMKDTCTKFNAQCKEHTDMVKFAKKVAESKDDAPKKKKKRHIGTLAIILIILGVLVVLVILWLYISKRKEKKDIPVSPSLGRISQSFVSVEYDPYA